MEADVPGLGALLLRVPKNKELSDPNWIRTRISP